MGLLRKIGTCLVRKMNNSQIDSAINALLRIAIALESIDKKLGEKK